MQLVKEGRNFSIVLTNKKTRLPMSFRALPFNIIIDKILGNKYFVSIAFVSREEIKRLNKKFRGINKSTDALSFSLGKETGEIIFSMNDVSLKAKSYNLKSISYLPYLLIHALLHLKGFSHSSKMERQEKEWCKRFKIKYPHL